MGSLWGCGVELLIVLITESVKFKVGGFGLILIQMTWHGMTFMLLVQAKIFWMLGQKWLLKKCFKSVEYH